MQVLAHKLRYADGQFRGTSGVIATAVLEGPSGFALDRSRSDQRSGRTRSRPRLRRSLAGRRGGAAADAHPPRPRRRRRHDRAATAGVPGLRARAWRAPHGVAGEAHRQRDADLWRPDGAALGRVRGGARGQPARAAWRRADPGGRARAGGRLHARARPAPRQLLPPGVENRLRGRHRRAAALRRCGR